MPLTCPITAIIPTWKRPEILRKALVHILACTPAPEEILVHIDAGDEQTGAMLEREFLNQVDWFQSETTQGPGGGRNLLLKRARFPIVASFDDDSWPIDLDYFTTLATLFERNPKVGVIDGHVTSRGETPRAKSDESWMVATFEGCACAYQREAFFSTRGFLPLRHAYGMEEVDVALQLLDANWSILRTYSLRVFHDSGLKHHSKPEINAAHIANTALLAALRYPLILWPLGFLQIMNRVWYSLRQKRYRGIFSGLIRIPSRVIHHWKFRHPVRLETLLRSRALSRAHSLHCQGNADS